MWMLVWEEGLLPLTEAQVGEVAWRSPAAWASTSHPVKSHQTTHSPLEALGQALLPVMAHGFDQRCEARLTLFVFLFPAFLRPLGPPTRKKQRQQKATNMLQKKKIYALSTSLFDWQKKHFCQRRDRELKLGQTAGLKVPKETCLDVISHFELP